MDFVRRLVGSKPRSASQKAAPSPPPVDPKRSADELTVFRPVVPLPDEETPTPPEPPPTSRGRPDQLTMMSSTPADESPPGDEAGSPGSEAATVYMQIPPEPEPAERSQVATLSVIEGELSGQVFPLLEGENQLGRAPDSDVVLASKYVSRTHARLVCNDGVVTFVPLSEQLTLINGNPAEETPLGDGDQIQLGRTTLVLRIGG